MAPGCDSKERREEGPSCAKVGPSPSLPRTVEAQALSSPTGLDARRMAQVLLHRYAGVRAVANKWRSVALALLIVTSAGGLLIGNVGTADASVSVTRTVQSISDGAPWWYTSMAVDSQDHVHLCFSDGADIYYANDAGGAMTSQTLEGAHGAGVDCCLAVDGQGRAHLSFTDGTDRDLHYATNASGLWSYEVVDSSGDVGRDSRIAVDGAGGVHIAYIGSGLKYAERSGGGWIVQTIDAEGEDVHAMVLDSRGHVHILYSDGANHRYATRADGGWSLETVVDRSLIPGGAMVVDAQDRVHFALVNANYELLYANESTGFWNAQRVATSVRADSPRIAGDTSGRAHIIYTDGQRSSLMYSTNLDGSWSSHTIEPQDGGASIFPGAVVVDSHGAAHALYLKGSPSTTDLVVRYAALAPEVHTLPGAPLDLTAVPGNGRAEISWSAPLSDGGSPITGYLVYWRMGAEGVDSSVFVNGTSYLRTDLVGGREYYCRVAAVNGEGVGASTSAIMITVLGRAPYPSAPRDLNATYIDGRVLLTWSPPIYGENITGYRVYRGTTSSMDNLVTVNGTFWEDRDLKGGVTYYYMVNAENGSGSGDLSDTVDVTVPTSFIDDAAAFLGSAGGVVMMAGLAVAIIGTAWYAMGRRRAR